MTLLELKQHLIRVRMTSLASLAVYFNADANVLRDMLGHWLRKGCVRKCQKTAACGGSCFKCDPLLTEVYEWVV